MTDVPARCVCGAVLPLYDPKHPDDFGGHWCEALDALAEGDDE